MAPTEDTDITNSTYFFDGEGFRYSSYVYSLNVVLRERYSVALWPVNSLNVLEK